MIKSGLWLGSGKLHDGITSLGTVVELDLEVKVDHGGITITGRLIDVLHGDVSIRVAPDEVGTCVLNARLASFVLDGIAKLESEPNAALLWNETGTQSASVTLFRASSGIACRGFYREGDKVRTWEILFKPKQVAVGGDNVVSLARRRR